MPAQRRKKYPLLLAQNFIPLDNAVEWYGQNQCIANMNPKELYVNKAWMNYVLIISLPTIS